MLAQMHEMVLMQGHQVVVLVLVLAVRVVQKLLGVPC
jgi:hypothetical protein